MKVKISEYLNIKRVEFIVTYSCPGRCRHCQNGDNFTDKQPLSVDITAAVNAVKTLSDLLELTSVMTFGGEPLLYPDTVCAIHKMATDCNIKTRQVITCGYFSNDNDKMREVARSLREAGVNNLLLSVDAFHQETIPLEPVIQFAEELKKVNLPGANIYPCWLISEEDSNPFNIETREILDSVRKIGLPIREGNIVTPTGNASVYLDTYVHTEIEDLSLPCDSLSNVDCISIEPDGSLSTCGFTLGNIYKQDITDILSRYNPYENEHMKAVLTGGPEALIKLTEGRGAAKISKNLKTRCEVCSYLTRNCCK